MLKSVSLLLSGKSQKLKMFMRKIFVQVPYALAAFAAVACCSHNASAYTVITVSTGAPSGFEQSFIAATTAQFTSSVFVNPYVANTFQVQLYGPNPSFNPPVTNQSLLNALISVSTQNYVYGWGDGVDWQRWHSLGLFNNRLDSQDNYILNCSSASYWNSLQVSTQAFPLVSIDSTTCMAVLSGVFNDIYNEFFSTPPAPTPPEPTPVPLGQ